MEICKQVLKSIHVESIKGLRDIRVEFKPDDSMVTGIFGPNGCGKSTLLHLLACSFKPASNGEKHSFGDFFLPTSSHIWSGSAFSLLYSQAEVRAQQPPISNDVNRRFEKKSDRWSPRYNDRSQRDCYYLGISTCVPRIETVKNRSRINFIASQPQTRQEVLSAARYILNRNYTSYEEYSTKDQSRYIGVTNPSGSYTELSMGAGEQRVFKILEKVHAAEKYSLVLIDEIDLLLHEQALMRLIEHLCKYCKLKSIQLVFTAHRHSLLDVKEVNFRHIMQSPGRTFCLTITTPDAMTQLLSEPSRPLRVFVEDDLAEALVNKLLEMLDARRYATITQFGSAMNAFTLAGAAALNGKLTVNDVFVLDGDVYRDDSKREHRMKQVVAGDDLAAVAKRAEALTAICQFTLPLETKPEAYIWEILRAEDPTTYAGMGGEIVSAAQEIAVVADSHQYVQRILDRTGYERAVGLLRVVDTLATTAAWPSYVAEIESRIRSCIVELNNQPSIEAQASILPSGPQTSSTSSPS